MITPADIETKVFSRAKRGYDEEEVDMYLDEIILEMERLLKENRDLKAKVELLSKQETQAKPASPDTSVYETLEAAKSLMNDIALSAERRAEVLLKNAELEASLITKEAKDNISRYTEEGNRLMNKVDSLRERYKRMLQDEIDRIDYSSEDILRDFERDFVPASMENVNTSEVKFEMPSGGAEKDIDLTKTMVISK